ncbi:MAG: OstA-like protein, partial [Chitinophagaceae bacterium]
YDMNTHIGSYLTGGKLVNQSTVLTSERGYYYADTKDVYFKSKVLLVDPQYTLTTDTLLYNTISRIATFVAPTTINTGNSIIHTTCGYYSTVQNYAHLCDRPTILDSAQQVTADSMNYTKSTGIGIAYGNVVWTDTSSKMTVLSNYAIANQLKNTILATEKPLLIIERKRDTLYLAMDTLFSGQLERPADTAMVEKVSVDSSQFSKIITAKNKSVSELDNSLTKNIKGTSKRPLKSKITASSKDIITLNNDTTNTKKDTSQLRYIIAYHHVRLFSDSLQGASDSLYYSDLDSAFHFYNNPVLWSGVSQLTGDTIVLFTKDQQASKIVLQHHAMIINKIEDSIYNQVKGNIITGYFGKGNELNWMNVNGNAESMYYAQDNNGAFAGGNHSTSAMIHLYFKDGKLNKVIFLKDVDGMFIPPTKIPDEDKMLQGFKWEAQRRPKTKTELMQ